jgi:hypothetical protein
MGWRSVKFHRLNAIDKHRHEECLPSPARCAAGPGADYVRDLEEEGRQAGRDARGLAIRLTCQMLGDTCRARPQGLMWGAMIDSNSRPLTILVFLQNSGSAACYPSRVSRRVRPGRTPGTRCRRDHGRRPAVRMAERIGYGFRLGLEAVFADLLKYATPGGLLRPRGTLRG